MKIKRKQSRALAPVKLEKNEDGVFKGVALSSELPVEQIFGREVLLHGPENVNLERRQIAICWNHDLRTFIGAATNLRVENKVLRADLRFSSRDEAKKVEMDVESGLLAENISLGYRIDDAYAEDGTYYVTKFTPLEVSVLPVPADYTVGFGRSLHDEENVEMRDDDKAQKSPETPEINQADLQAEAVRQERARVTAIRSLFQMPQFRANEKLASMMDTAIDEGHSIEHARAQLLEALGNQEPISTRSVRTESGEDALDKFARGFGEALSIKARAMPDEELRNAQRSARQNSDFMAQSIADMALRYLDLVKVPTRGLSRDQAISRALTFRNTTPGSWQATTDFPAILENVVTKSLVMGYNEAPQTWRAWCSVGTVTDFRPASRPAMSAFSSLAAVAEGATYTFGTFGDKKETIQLLTYGKLFGITRQALVNDDLNAFGRVPRAMGAAAARTINSLPYDKLIANANMNEDGNPLFDNVNHSNLVIGGSGGPPSVATLDAVNTAMATQKDPSGAATLNIGPRFLIVPKALETTARTLIAATYDPAGVVGTMTPNPFQGAMTVVSDALLDADSTTAWYVAADPSMIDTIEVAFLDGIEEPFLDTQDGWNADGVEFKVRIDAGANPLDWRGLAKNVGN